MEWTVHAIIVAVALGTPGGTTLAFSLFPDRPSADLVTTLQVATRWSAEVDPFGYGTGFHDDIQIAVASDFAAMLGVDTAEDAARLRDVIRAAFGAWATADLHFDIGFDRVPVEGTTAAGFEIDLFAVPASHPVFANTLYFGVTYVQYQMAPARLLANGQRFDGLVTTGADIYINTDLVLALAALVPEDRWPSLLQRLLMHEIGHALGLGHPNTYTDMNANYDTDFDPLDPMPVDPRVPFALLIISPNRNAQAIMSNDRSHTGRFLLFTTLQNDDRGGRDVLYPRARFCPADCDGDGQVDVAELVTGTGMALSELPLQACPSADDDRDGAVFVDEIVLGVRNALTGCAPGSAATHGLRALPVVPPNGTPQVATIRCGLP